MSIFSLPLQKRKYYFFFALSRPDVSKISVSIGHGFFLELSLSEALDFIPKKIMLLSQRLTLLEEESSRLNADIKMMLDTLGQLQKV